MSEISKERVEALASNILECHDVKPSEIKALAGLALLALRERAEPVVVPDLHKVVYHFRDLNEGFPVERFKADYVIAWMLANYPPAPPAPVVPDALEQFAEFMAAESIKAGDYPDGWKCKAANAALEYAQACRAAMLATPSSKKE